MRTASAVATPRATERRRRRSRRVSADPASAFLAGGTTEVDLLRLGVARPDRLVDINALPLAEIEELPDGGLRIGALARMSDVARAPRWSRALSRRVAQALLLGASAQLRNMASMGGNLLPAGALRVLPRRRLAVQQARARAAAARRWTGSTAATRSSAPASTASPPTPRTWRSRSSPSTRSCTRVGPDGDAGDPDRRLLPAARRHAAARASARARRADRRRSRCRRSPVARALALPEGPRPRSRTSSRSSRWRPRSTSRTASIARRAARARRRRHQAVAGPARRGSADRRARRRGARSPAPPRRSCAGRQCRERQRVQGRARAAGDRPRRSTRATNGRCAMSPAIGRPVDRVDGPAKVTGAARYTAEIALPGLAYAAHRRRDDRRAAGSPPSTRATRERGRRRARGAHPPEPAEDRGAAAPAAVAGRRRRRPARASSRCRTTSCTTPASRWRWSSPTRHERAQYAASLVRVEYERDAVDHDDRRGPRRSAYEAERLFGGLMPGRNERGDVEAGARGGRRAGRRRPTASPPTTTTRSSRRPRPRSGTATG